MPVMAKPRKTVSLRELVDWVNERNATSTCEPSVREGWNSLASTFLMSTNAYAGFGYLRSDELAGDAKGKPPGIVPDDSGDSRHEFPDETRIRFIIRKGL
jgi:hypothetical protein